MYKEIIVFGIFMVIVIASVFYFLMWPNFEFGYACEKLAKEQDAILKNYNWGRMECVLAFCDPEEVVVNNKTFVDNCREEVWRLKV